MLNTVGHSLRKHLKIDSQVATTCSASDNHFFVDGRIKKNKETMKEE